MALLPSQRGDPGMGALEIPDEHHQPILFL